MCSIRVLEDELSNVRARSELVDSYERQIRRLNDDLSLLSVRRDLSLPEYVVFCDNIICLCRDICA